MSSSTALGFVFEVQVCQYLQLMVHLDGWPTSRGVLPLSSPELEGHVNAAASGLLFYLSLGAGTPMQALVLAQTLPYISTIFSSPAAPKTHSAEQTTRITDSDP